MNNIEIGNNVIINEQGSVFQGVKGVVKKIDNSTCTIGVQISGVDFLVSLKKEDLIIVEPKKKVFKSNKLHYGAATIEWDINDNNLSVKLEGHHINIKTFLKILIQEMPELKKFKYTRVSPYKIEHEYARDRDDKTHVFAIQFIDVKDNNKIKSAEIIRADWRMAVAEGTYNFFIPDLLEVAVNRNLMVLNKDVYECREQAFKKALEVEYVDTSMSKETLLKQGWTIPVGYEEP